MLFRQLFDATSSTYTYLLAADYGQEAIIIDPVIDQLALYLQLFRELNLRLKISLDTHIHADHITASASLREHTQCEIAMGEHSKAQGLTKKIKEQQHFGVQGIDLKAIYTPGHTDDSYSFLMSDRVFTGDALMIRGTGRTDFQNGDSYQAYDSLFNKLLLLPDTTFVYPGHDYKGMTVTTIGEEKRNNPRLQIKSAPQYAELMANLKLAHPKQIDVAVPANLHCGLQNFKNN